MRIVTTVIILTAAMQPVHDNHRANIVLYLTCLAWVLFFFNAI